MLLAPAGLSVRMAQRQSPAFCPHCPEGVASMGSVLTKHPYLALPCELLGGASVGGLL